jgi:hypothetical protein
LPPYCPRSRQNQRITEIFGMLVGVLPANEAVVNHDFTPNCKDTPVTARHREAGDRQTGPH